MRDDDVGMFWQDYPREKGKRGEVVRPMPPIPDTEWKAPEDFPNLAAAKVLRVDTETWDPELTEHGPGWARGKGHLVGDSVAADHDGAWYFAMRHEVEPQDTVDPDNVLAGLRDTLGNPRQHKIGANLQYDIGWLAEEGVSVRGPLFDVQLAEALLQEQGTVALDYLGQKYCGEGKESNALYQWCADFYGGQPDGKQRKNMHRTPPRLAGPYGVQDAALPLRVAEKQWPLLHEQRLLDVARMENGLIPLLVAMRRAGVRVDVARAEQLREDLLVRERALQERLDALAGCAVNVHAATDLARAFENAGLSYPHTDKGAPSFQRVWLEHHAHPLAGAVTAVRRIEKLRRTFVEGYILDAHVNGKVYGSFHLLRGDGSGARSGRFSSSTPNLQNIPSRDKELAPLVRGLFVPDDGHEQWRRYDYSQIEYRLLVHFAQGPGADAARAQFNADPSTDYHQFVIDLLAREAGQHLDRKTAKTINFGLIYGMGKKKLTETLGLSKAEGKKLFDAYHKAIPYAHTTMDAAVQEAERTGVIDTLLGRRSRFDLWEPAQWTDCGERGALPHAQAVRKWGNIRRAYTHKALNRRLQGSAADVMKYAMWRCWEDGVFDATGVPRITVHDELDFSDPGGREDAFAYCKQVLENALQLSIPVLADEEVGPDWGNLNGA